MYTYMLVNLRCKFPYFLSGVQTHIFALKAMYTEIH